MGMTAGRLLAMVTAIALVFSFYAPTVLGLDPSETTPPLAAVIAFGLGSMSALWLVNPRLATPYGAMRQLAACAFAVAWALFLTVGLAGFFDRSAALNDWGLFLLQVAAPVLLLCSNERASLLRSIGLICTLAALADAAANLGALVGFWDLAHYGGRYIQGVVVQRYPGLTASSHAAGLVGLVAICFTVTRLKDYRRLAGWLATVAVTALIVTSLFLIDARRYIGEGAVAGALLILGWRRAPLQFVAMGVGALGVWFTVTSLDGENIQRANLMFDALRDAMQSPWTGGGVFYRAAPSQGDFNALWNAHVTESGILDLAISYGFPATIAFLAAPLLALSGRRPRLTWPAVMLALTTGELAYGDPLVGFLGAVVFFGSLFFVLLDESPRPTR